MTKVVHSIIALVWAELFFLPCHCGDCGKCSQKALIQHISPFGYQRSVILAGREMTVSHPVWPFSNHQQLRSGSTGLSVPSTSLLWAMNNTCKASSEYFCRDLHWLCKLVAWLLQLRLYLSCGEAGATGDAPCAHTCATKDEFHHWGGVNESLIPWQVMMEQTEQIHTAEVEYW